MRPAASSAFALAIAALVTSGAGAQDRDDAALGGREAELRAQLAVDAHDHVGGR